MSSAQVLLSFLVHIYADDTQYISRDIMKDIDVLRRDLNELFIKIFGLYWINASKCKIVILHNPGQFSP